MAGADAQNGLHPIDKQLLDRSQWDFSDLNAIVITAIDHGIATGVYPDMTEHGWDRDEWPQIFEQVTAANILVLLSPIWLGEKSSLCTQVIERLYGNSHLLNDAGRWAYYGRVDGCIMTANEDGAQTLRDEHPLLAAAPWLRDPTASRQLLLGEAGPGPSYSDAASGGPENDFTNRNTTFLAWNLLHLARMLKDTGGIARARQPSRAVGRGLPVRLRERGCAGAEDRLEQLDVDLALPPRPGRREGQREGARPSTPGRPLRGGQARGDRRATRRRAAGPRNHSGDHIHDKSLHSTTVIRATEGEISRQTPCKCSRNNVSGRSLHTREVAGSSPAVPIEKAWKWGVVVGGRRGENAATGSRGRLGGVPLPARRRGVRVLVEVAAAQFILFGRCGVEVSGRTLVLLAAIAAASGKGSSPERGVASCRDGLSPLSAE